MIDVYIRELNASEGCLLGHFPPDQVRYLPDLFKSHEIYVEDIADTVIFYRTQFVVTEASCYFEIIVEHQEE